MITAAGLLSHDPQSDFAEEKKSLIDYIDEMERRRVKRLNSLSLSASEHTRSDIDLREFEEVSVEQLSHEFSVVVMDLNA